MADFHKETAFEIGRRLEIRGPYSWFIVLRPVIEHDVALEDFTTDLSAVLGRPTRMIHGLASFETLRADLNEPPDDPVLISDLDQADDSQWRALDINRSGLVREGPVVLWLSGTGVARLCQHAPNLKSFIGGSFLNLVVHREEMTGVELEQRVLDLESHFKMSSAEVVIRAESGALPVKPHFVEWLFSWTVETWFECPTERRNGRGRWM